MEWLGIRTVFKDVWWRLENKLQKGTCAPVKRRKSLFGFYMDDRRLQQTVMSTRWLIEHHLSFIENWRKIKILNRWSYFIFYQIPVCACKDIINPKGNWGNCQKKWKGKSDAGERKSGPICYVQDEANSGCKDKTDSIVFRPNYYSWEACK